MSVNIPNLFLLNASGEMLVEKQWLGRFDRQVCDLFFELTSKESNRVDIAPIIPIGPYYFLQTNRNDIFFLTIVEQETIPSVIFEFQQLVLDTLLTYISTISENAIRENFVLVYQLLDEMNHGGFSYTTEKNQLTEMIALPSLANKMLDVLHIGSPTTTLKGDLSSAAVSKIPWRSDNVSYIRKNAVYFDIVESLDAILSPDGSVLSSIAHGQVQCKSQLSGVPDLALSLQRQFPIQDCSLHRCVRLARFERDRIISFVPPDGEFTLCSYKVDNNINIPIYVRPEFNWTQDKCTFSISFGQRASFSTLLEDIAIVIPIPKACSATVTQANIGTVRTDQLTHTCRWEVSEMPKDHHPLKNEKLLGGIKPTIPTITGTFTLTRDVPADERPTLRVLFMLKKYSSTGTNIDGLVVKNVNYEPTRGVRVICKAGKVQVRTE